jgi:hypothetical protein
MSKDELDSIFKKSLILIQCLCKKFYIVIKLQLIIYATLDVIALNINIFNDLTVMIDQWCKKSLHS